VGLPLSSSLLGVEPVPRSRPHSPERLMATPGRCSSTSHPRHDRAYCSSAWTSSRVRRSTRTTQLSSGWDHVSPGGNEMDPTHGGGCATDRHAACPLGEHGSADPLRRTSQPGLPCPRISVLGFAMGCTSPRPGAGGTTSRCRCCTATGWSARSTHRGPRCRGSSGSTRSARMSRWHDRSPG